MSVYCFKPSLIGSLALLIAVPSFIGLGFWQIARGDLKQSWQHTFQQQQALPPLAFTTTQQQQSPQSLYWRHATVQGQFLNKPQLLLDNQRLNDKVGYVVLSPFQLADSGAILWINRGWLPIHTNRDAVPDLTLAHEPQQLSGTLRPAPARPALFLGTIAEQREQLKPTLWRIQVFEFETVNTWFSLPSLPWVLQLAAPQQTELTSYLEPPDSNAQRHYGYALQWFSFAAVAVVLFIGLSMRRVASTSVHET